MIIHYHSTFKWLRHLISDNQSIQISKSRHLTRWIATHKKWKHLFKQRWIDCENTCHVRHICTKFLQGMISFICTFGLGNNIMHQRMFPSPISACKGLKIVCHLSILFRCFYCLFASNELALSSDRTCNWTTLWVYHGTPEPSTSEWLYIPFGKCHGI